jgi:signal transduction histidine kinase/CheY-like chemotaxis protein
MNSLFNSELTLKFQDKELEKKYNTMRHTSILKYNIIYSSIGLIYSIYISIMYKYFFQIQQAELKQINMGLNYTVLTLQFIILLLGIFIRNPRFQQIIALTNFYILMFMNQQMNRYLISNYKVDVRMYSLSVTLQYLYRFTWYFSNCLDFLEGFLLTIVMSVSYYLFYGFQTPLVEHNTFSATIFMYVIGALVMYFYIKEKRKSYYYHTELEKRVNWYGDIFDNMNSGLISFANLSLKYINTTMFNFILSNKNTLNIAKLTPGYSDKEKERLYDNTVDQNYLILREFFTGLKHEGGLNYETAGFDTDVVYNILAYLEKNKNDSNFKYLGTKHLDIISNNSSSFNIDGNTNSFIYLEVQGRCFVTNNGEKNFEFIFNDVSRIKIIEETNAEFKFKSLLLSKVAHEFKNPLLCIVELVDSIMEIVEVETIVSNSSSNSFEVNKLSKEDLIKEILTKIKSMSDYLIILVKDMDHFSQKYSSNNEDRNHLDYSLVQLDSITTFCQDITKTLLHKYDKANSVVLYTIVDSNIPEYIYIDEIKLKQVLVNLLSNAVKYTIRGCINFEVQNTEGHLKFTITDTGKGIPESVRSTLFTPFNKQSFKNNGISAGLGLSIVKDLITQIGSKIEYESEIGRGTSFHFKIPNKRISSTNIVASCGVTPFRRPRSKPDSYQSQSNNSSSTIVKEFQPVINQNVKNSYFYININKIDEVISYNPNSTANVMNNVGSKSALNILLVDDEELTRKATKRVLSNLFALKSYKLNIYEATDGIECLFNYYKYIKEGVKLSFIVSDESMDYMGGIECAGIIKKIEDQCNVTHVPFFILSAYDYLRECNGVDKVFMKPLNRLDIDRMIELIKLG